MYDYVIVGSGAGGATAAKELSSAGKSVLLLEKGPNIGQGNASKAYVVIKAGVEVWQTSCLGGTTTVSMGNVMRSNLSQKLDEHMTEAEQEMNAWTIPPDKLGPASRLLRGASREWKPMPKAIDLKKCISCGLCAIGCLQGAKWDACRYIEQAVARGCKVATNAGVRKVMVDGGRAIGVETIDGRVFKGNNVILAAGAIETPRVLFRSGVDSVGMGLFVDTFVTVGGVLAGAGQNHEVGMGLYIERDGYLLSPHHSALLLPMLAERGIKTGPQDILSIMVKIKDEPSGVVRQGAVVKESTKRDLDLLEMGRKEAIDLLIKAGVDEKTIVEAHTRGAHPGGTCSAFVRSPVKTFTDIKSLSIADASVIPGPFGIPPMLTIVAVAKRLCSLLLGRA
jgi:choline dehydrogenase-like flavoprotein